MRLGASLLAALLLAGCNGSTDDGRTWPELGSETEPVHIATSRLELGSDPVRVFVDPTQSFQLPWGFYDEVEPGDPAGGKLRDGIVRHHYPHMTVAGHYSGTGTYVFYDADAGAFFLWGDDFAGHFDGMVGPFAGDPRVVLAAVAEPA